MFQFIKKKIAQRRMKKLNESSFPTCEMRTSGDPIQKWFSDWFMVNKSLNYPRYYFITPIIKFNTWLKHGVLIQKYIQNSPNSQLTDDSYDFRKMFGFDWKEFKDYNSDSYQRMKKIYTVLQIWDDLLDCPVNRAMLEAGVHIQTSSWCRYADLSVMWVNPKHAELLMNTLDDLCKDALELERDIINRYKDYVLTAFAQEDLSVLSASHPSIKIDTFSNHRVKILKNVLEEKTTVELSIIQKIKDKKTELMRENDKK